MKYHNRMGEGRWEARNYEHDSLVTQVLSNFDFYNTSYLARANTSQHKLQYNRTKITVVVTKAICFQVNLNQ
jgi:hypothetical protein